MQVNNAPREVRYASLASALWEHGIEMREDSYMIANYLSDTPTVTLDTVIDTLARKRDLHSNAEFTQTKARIYAELRASNVVPARGMVTQMARTEMMKQARAASCPVVPRAPAIAGNFAAPTQTNSRWALEMDVACP